MKSGVERRWRNPIYFHEASLFIEYLDRDELIESIQRSRNINNINKKKIKKV